MCRRTSLQEYGDDEDNGDELHSLCMNACACGLTADGEAVHVVPGELGGKTEFIL